MMKNKGGSVFNMAFYYFSFFNATLPNHEKKVINRNYCIYGNTITNLVRADRQ